MALLAEAYLHTLDEFAYKFPASWPYPGLRWYGLAYLAGFGVAWLIVRWMAKTHRTAIPPRAVPDLMIYILLGVLVGGRVGYCIFYDPKLLIGFMPALPYWRLLAINQGGMSSHGGMLGVILAMCIFGARNHISKLHLLDVAVFVAPPGLFLGRLANFVNAELPGRALPDALQQAPPWWSMKFPQEILSWPVEKLARLGEAVEDLGFSAGHWRDSLARMDIDADANQFVQRTVNRLIEAVQSGNETVIAVMRPELTACYPSQLVQAITDGPILGLLLVLVWLKPRKPGLIGVWFLGGYGLMRIASEGIRKPDIGVPLLSTPMGDLSRGQVLSLLMVAVWLVAWLIIVRRDAEPIGGMLKKSQ